MQKATISQLKNRLSAYLDRVRAGETVLILDREQPIARIERAGAELSTGERLLGLQRAGLVRQPTQPFPLDLLRRNPAVPCVAPGRGLLQALLDERSDGR